MDAATFLGADDAKDLKADLVNKTRHMTDLYKELRRLETKIEEQTNVVEQSQKHVRDCDKADVDALSALNDAHDAEREVLSLLKAELLAVKAKITDISDELVKLGLTSSVLREEGMDIAEDTNFMTRYLLKLRLLRFVRYAWYVARISFSI